MHFSIHPISVALPGQITCQTWSAWLTNSICPAVAHGSTCATSIEWCCSGNQTSRHQLGFGPGCLRRTATYGQGQSSVIWPPWVIRSSTTGSSEGTTPYLVFRWCSAGTSRGQPGCQIRFMLEHFCSEFGTHSKLRCISWSDGRYERVAAVDWYSGQGIFSPEQCPEYGSLV